MKWRKVSEWAAVSECGRYTVTVNNGPGYRFTAWHKHGKAITPLAYTNDKAEALKAITTHAA